MRTPEQEDSYELHVARDVYNQNFGKFVEYFAGAVQHADSSNFELVRPVWRQLVRKYGLGCDAKCKADGTGWTGPIPEWVTAHGRQSVKHKRRKRGAYVAVDHMDSRPKGGEP